jgi:hypothetical protein
MMRRLHLALISALFAVVSAPVHGASTISVSGSVRDSAGVPQIGAIVQLLSSDLSVIRVVYTTSKGIYSIPNVAPGRYAVKAMGTLFLPSLRENVRVRSNTVVNLTLNTLYEAMQWLPAEPRAANAPKDDWAWTLRSAANRPLLRWLEDGPLVVVSDRSGAHPRLKARLMATGQEGTFGESGERITSSVEETPSGSRELLARVDFAPDSDAGMESMLGFRQDLGFAGSVQSMAAVSIHPEIDGANGEGLDEAAVRSWETMNLGDEFEIEAGSQQVIARFGQHSPNTVVAALPFATVAWRGGDSTVRYRMSTAPTPMRDMDGSDSSFAMPALVMRNGELAMQRGLHQEIGWERRTDTLGVAFCVYSDHIQSPIVQAAAGEELSSSGDLLADRNSGLVRTAGPDYSTAGIVASVERELPGGNHVRLSYANGDALVMYTPSRAANLGQLMRSVHPRHSQMYSISLSGTLEGTGTRWRATYRWQPADTVTSVASYQEDALSPYLSVHVRQPIRVYHDGVGVDALLNVRNLLAEGYRPFLLNNGTQLIFAQDQRSIGGGVAFTF